MAYKVYHKKNLFLKENKEIERITENAISFTKGELNNLFLNEDDNRTGYVTPSSQDGSSSNLASDIQDAMTNNPTTHDFVVDGNNYDGDASDNDLTVTVDGKNPNEIAKQIKTIQKSPQGQKMGGDMKFRVHGT